MSQTIRANIKEQEINAFNRGYTKEEQEANNLRMDFFRKYILNFDTHLYKTQVERDFAYLAKREHTYDVYIKTCSYSATAGCLATSLGMFMAKRAVFWPFFAVSAASYAYFYPRFFTMHNKKFFDMCNVGEEYYLGAQRNFVLRKCNELLDREDF